ncbi:hypothetical protein AC579_5375 [Pseudocercospora musae]|uniref:Uncharacterized protein n=1 Tax=Pseudocercospora musae TaxID=113226 RepID=A0A139H403_9PEZI|nr:hypothetical protein AC579_5375 [Pseudocercospora musae]
MAHIAALEGLGFNLIGAGLAATYGLGHDNIHHLMNIGALVVLKVQTLTTNLINEAGELRLTRKFVIEI